MSSALEELTETQNQLILQEKMASLGKMVAGIAHEINNPIGAMSSAVDTFKRCLKKIETELDSPYRKRVDKPLKLMQDNMGVLNTAEKRIKTLVNSLKNFARLDEAEMQRADIHEGLESTLTLLKSELSEKIKIVKEFGDLPLLFCSPGQLNQAFMSLLQNAIQSISETGTINIKTFLKDDHIYVQVADTGKGIPHDKLENILSVKFNSNVCINQLQVIYLPYKKPGLVKRFVITLDSKCKNNFLLLCRAFLRMRAGSTQGTAEIFIQYPSPYYQGNGAIRGSFSLRMAA